MLLSVRSYLNPSLESSSMVPFQVIGSVQQSAVPQVNLGQVVTAGQCFCEGMVVCM